MQMKVAKCPLWAMAVVIAATPLAASAYMGPGLGLGALGTALGVVGAVFLGILSVVWYPFKRLLRRLRGKRGEQAGSGVGKR